MARHDQAATTKTNYAQTVAQADRNGVGVPFGTGVGQDAKQPEIYAVGLRQSGLGMPDRDYYLDPKNAKEKTAYQAHIAKMFTLAGDARMPRRVRRRWSISKHAIANVSWTRIDSRDATKTVQQDRGRRSDYRRAPGFDFVTYLKGIGTPVDTVIVGQPSAITGIAKLIGDAPIQVLQDQLAIRSLDNFADVLPSTFDKEQFAFYGTTLSGTPQQEERWKRAVGFTSGALSDDVSKVYVARYFPPETKAAADKLVRNVITAMGARIDKLDWMAPETKVKAHAKLAAFTPKIGYPSQWRDYSALTITPAMLSATSCARHNGGTTIILITSASRSSAGNGE